MGLLGREGAEELAACGDVAEEVAHVDAGAGRGAAVPDLGEEAGVDGEAGAALVLGAARGEGEARDGGDGGDGLAAEAEGVDALDVVHVADLRGGLAFQREEGVLARHAAAVVPHRDEPAPA